MDELFLVSFSMHSGVGVLGDLLAAVSWCRLLLAKLWLWSFWMVAVAVDEGRDDGSSCRRR